MFQLEVASFTLVEDRKQLHDRSWQAFNNWEDQRQASMYISHTTAWKHNKRCNKCFYLNSATFIFPFCPLGIYLLDTWVLIAVGLFVGGIHPQIGWLWSTLTTFYCFCAGPDPGSRTHSSRFWHLLRSPFGCVACVTTWVILWHDLEPATWVCLFWGLLRGTPMQVKVRSGLSLALGHLFGAAVWSTVRAAYLWPGCLWEGPSCLPLELSLELSLELVTKRPKTPQDLSPLLSAC